MLTLLAALTILSENPKDVLKTIQEEYQQLNSFSMDIEHHNSSGLFPGSYQQALAWRGRRFELKVTKASDFKPVDSHPGGLAPNYKCDGTSVASNPGSVREINTDANSMPGWEVSGGFILSWLMKTPSANFLVEPPKGFAIEYSFGPTTQWKDLAVNEIILSMSAGGRKAGMSLYVSPDRKSFLGFESKEITNPGWAIYRNQRRNPNLPKDLGTIE